MLSYLEYVVHIVVHYVFVFVIFSLVFIFAEILLPAWPSDDKNYFTGSDIFDALFLSSENKQFRRVQISTL